MPSPSSPPALSPSPRTRSPAPSAPGHRSSWPPADTPLTSAPSLDAATPDSAHRPRLPQPRPVASRRRPRRHPEGDAGISTPLPPSSPTPAPSERDGQAVIRNAITPDLRGRLLIAAKKLLASSIVQGRDRGGDGKDGFRGCFNRDFLPLLANPAVLPTVVGLLSPNIHLLSALPSGPPRTIRIPGRHGWHRDMYGVTADLGFPQTPAWHRRSPLREPDLAHRRHPLRQAPHRPHAPIRLPLAPPVDDSVDDPAACLREDPALTPHRAAAPRHARPPPGRFPRQGQRSPSHPHLVRERPMGFRVGPEALVGLLGHRIRAVALGGEMAEL
ncbi:hypothetical protein OKW18_000764 [Streptomyces pratensis]|nr:hypothetical protein [Streptomyces pratensis]